MAGIPGKKASPWLFASVLQPLGSLRLTMALIERANVAHCSGGFAEAVLLRRTYAVMKEAARAADESATRGVSPPGAPPTSPSTVTIKLGLTMAP